MKVLVWHWGRHGAGPRFATELAAGLARLPGVTANLSLASQAEILTIHEPPHCDLPVHTYTGWPGLVARWATAPAMLARLDQALAHLQPDLAVCAMPAAIDPFMLRSLRRRCIPSIMIVHDALPHAGDGGWPRAIWDRAVLCGADAVGVLSQHVGAALGTAHPRLPVLALSHPPFGMGPLTPPRVHGGKLRVLSFGRLRAYKGLDLLAETLRQMSGNCDARVVGAGPEIPALASLRTIPGVTVENRWVPETELPSLLGWADVVLLTHRAASQSGVAAAAIGAGRFVVATAVGGMIDQLRSTPGVTLCAPDPRILATALRATAEAPLPMQPDTNAEWRAMGAELLAATCRLGLLQRQPRAIAAASCSAVKSGPVWPPTDPSPPRPVA